MIARGDEVMLVVNGDGIRATIIAASGGLIMLAFDGCIDLDEHSSAVGALIARQTEQGWREFVTRIPVSIETLAGTKLREVMSEHDEWHARRGQYIHVNVEPTEAQCKEIAWRVRTGQPLLVETIGPASAFRAQKLDDPIDPDVMEVVNRIAAAVGKPVTIFNNTQVSTPYWMYNGLITKIIPVWRKLEPIGGGLLFRHRT